ncbi:MAG: HTTM domain-containing protein [Bacteroidota bacterium]
MSLFCLILCFLPANSIASLDGKQARINETKIVPYWTHCIILLQIGIIYVFAGIAKINTDWLIDAMPLKIWLPAHSTIPIIGPLLSLDITAYIFSWFGMLYDMSHNSIYVKHINMRILISLNLYPSITPVDERQSSPKTA